MGVADLALHLRRPARRAAQVPLLHVRPVAVIAPDIHVKPRVRHPAVRLIAGLFAIVVVCNLVFLLFSSDFIPTTYLKEVADVSVAILLVFLVFAFSGEAVSRIKEKYANGSLKSAIGTTSTVLFFPIFVWAMIHVFFAGPLSYVLHLTHVSGGSVGKDLTVLGADDLGGRGCRNRAILKGTSSLFWKPTLCSIPGSSVDKLRRGGVVKVRGTFTEFGAQVTYYALVEKETGLDPASLTP
jgi:hypothetical protein